MKKDIREIFPAWDTLTPEEKERLIQITDKTTLKHYDLEGDQSISDEELKSAYPVDDELVRQNALDNAKEEEEKNA